MTRPEPSSVLTPPSNRLGLRRTKNLKRILAAVGLFLGLVFGTYGCERSANHNRVLRGVYLGSVSLSGLTRAEVRLAIERSWKRTLTRPVHASVSGRLFQIPSGELGLAIDLDKTVDGALRKGRDGTLGSQLAFWASSLLRASEVGYVVSIEPKLLDAQLHEWEQAAVSQRPFPGGLTYQQGKLAARYPAAGLVVDRARARQAVVATYQSGNRLVRIPLEEKSPGLSRGAVDRALARANELTRAKITLENVEEEVSAEFPTQDLGEALRAAPVDGRDELRLTFDQEVLAKKLSAIRKRLEVQPRDARFAIKRNKVTIEPSHNGTLVQLDRIASELLRVAEGGATKGTLFIKRSAIPQFTTEQAEALGIEKLVATFTTYHPCCQKRVDNIHRIARMLDGVIVPAGESFSVNERVGPRTRALGFVPAPTIEHGKMVDSVGGGISQFATTLFNSLFDAGYQIIQRQPHSYWFSRYPEGIEATLSFPLPDLAFKNDSDAGVLIKTEFGPKFIRVKLFGNNGGRKVRRIVSRRFDFKDPPITYEADDSLDPEEEKVRAGGRKGWSIVVTRKIAYANGKEAEQTRKVVYSPRERVVRLHSCRIPEGEEGHSGKECPEPEEDAGADVEAAGDEPTEPAGEGTGSGSPVPGDSQEDPPAAGEAAPSPADEE